MVSRGMLWARKSCQAQYCSKVSQSRLWTEETEKRYPHSYSQSPSLSLSLSHTHTDTHTDTDTHTHTHTHKKTGLIH